MKWGLNWRKKGAVTAEAPEEKEEGASGESARPVSVAENGVVLPGGTISGADKSPEAAEDGGDAAEGSGHESAQPG